MTEVIDIEQFEKVAFILKTIAHPLRIRIADLLSKHEELSVNEICAILGSEQSLTSHHLNTMKLKGVLNSKRQGQNVYYSLLLKEVKNVISCIRNCNV
ncbi:MAG: metalloregulator ArsR/SmtB family transcription factor [Cyclobacteriaceae bacterium]|nr:metalloregulator ArsR/SmtB family transcription factor [Cyclobacteriaceae bacterium]